MLLVTTENIGGQRITDTLGVVRGSSVRAKWFGKDILAGLRNIIGGELPEYAELLNEARDAALERLVASAEELEADAVVGIRFTTSAITAQAAEIHVYGTAVKTESVS